MIKRGLFTLLFGSSVLISCTQDKVTEDAPDPCNEDYTYSDDIEAIIMNNCATSGCHNGAQSPALNSYSAVEAKKDRVKARAVDLKTMPPSGPLSDAEIQKISCWIEQGAKE